MTLYECRHDGKGYGADVRMLYPNPRELEESEFLASITAQLPRTIRANMVLSLDGATAIDGDSSALSSATDRLLYRQLRREAEAVLVGRTTGSHPGYRKLTKPLVVFSNSGHVESSAQELICVTTTNGQANVKGEVIVAGEEVVDLAKAIAQLHKRGLTKLLCEGGPGLLSELLNANLIDELFLTYSPIVAGNSSVRIRLEAPQEFQLQQLLEDSGHLFAHYA